MKKPFSSVALLLILVFTLATMFGGAKEVAGASSSYDSEAAVNYAETWWNGRNPVYHDYGDYDCANFVSQCLVAGGLNLGICPYVDAWGCIPSCDNLHQYLVNYLGAQHEVRRRGEVEPPWFLKGDPAIFGDDSDNWRHAVFAVIEDESNYARCNAHSQNVYHIAISSFFEANPDFTLCNYYHISAQESLDIQLRALPNPTRDIDGATISAYVTSGGEPIEGAYVEFSFEPGAPPHNGFDDDDDPDTPPVAEISGTTNQLGEFQAHWGYYDICIAFEQVITFHATASKEGYTSASDSCTLVVLPISEAPYSEPLYGEITMTFPSGPNNVYVTLSPATGTITSGQTVYFEIQIGREIVSIEELDWDAIWMIPVFKNKAGYLSEANTVTVSLPDTHEVQAEVVEDEIIVEVDHSLLSDDWIPISSVEDLNNIISAVEWLDRLHAISKGDWIGFGLGEIPDIIQTLATALYGEELGHGPEGDPFDSNNENLELFPLAFGVGSFGVEGFRIRLPVKFLGEGTVDVNFHVAFAFVNHNQYVLNYAGAQFEPLSFTVRRPKVLFEDAHDMDTDDLTGNYAKLKTALEGEGYVVEDVKTGPITYDTLEIYDVVILPDLEIELSSSEIAAFAEYLSSGGRLLIIGEWKGAHIPSTVSAVSRVAGIEFDNTIVYDPDNYVSSAQWPVIHEVDSTHAIGNGISNFAMYAGSSLVLTSEDARAIAWGDDNTYTQDPLIGPNEPDWNVTDPEGPEAGDPIVLAVSEYSVEGGKTRLVCVGDSDLWKTISWEWSGYDPIENYDNKQLLINIVNWLAEPMPQEEGEESEFGTITEGETRTTTVEVEETTGTLELTLEWVGSDLDLHVFDPQNRHVGFNYLSEQADLEIPYSQYSGRNAKPEWIRVLNPEPGVWTVEVLGVEVEGTELFRLEVSQQRPEDLTPPTTSLDIGSPKFVDSLGNVYITSSTILTLDAIDDSGTASGVALTDYKIYNSSYGTGWITGLPPMFFQIEELNDGTYYIDYNSTDNAGNVESTKTQAVILDNTPPTTTLTIGEPKYISDKTYVTPDTSFTLEATDTGSGVYSTAYRIYNATYDRGWQTYTTPFKLTSLTDGTYTIEYNSTDNVKNTETTHAINVTLFSWNYIYQDTYGRGTTLKINLAHKFFQFIAPNKDYGIRKATYMKQCGRAIIIQHCDSELRLITVAVDTKLDFCYAMAWDTQTRKCYFLIDKAGIEK
jgi:hypothetical protein